MRTLGQYHRLYPGFILFCLPLPDASKRRFLKIVDNFVDLLIIQGDLKERRPVYLLPVQKYIFLLKLKEHKK